MFVYNFIISNDYYYYGSEETMANLKYSRQREAIRAYLMASKEHPTAEMVYDNMKRIYPNISLGTVYRNLQLLAGIGQITRLHGVDGMDHFDGRTDRHNHFFCTCCGGIVDLDMESIDDIKEVASKNFPGEIQNYTARFFGLCEDCVKKKNNASDT